MKNEKNKKIVILDALKKQGKQFLYFFKNNKIQIFFISTGFVIGFLAGNSFGMKEAIKQYSKNINLKAESIY